jgi:hypothetical protein
MHCPAAGVLQAFLSTVADPNVNTIRSDLAVCRKESGWKMEVDGKDVMPDVHGVLDKLKGFADQVLTFCFEHKIR